MTAVSTQQAVEKPSNGESVLNAAQYINNNRWILWLVAVQLMVLYGPTAAWLWERWTLSVWHHGHGLLILAVVIYLVWQELQKHRDWPVASNPWGFAILVPALAMHMLDTGIHTQLMSAASLILALPGFSLLFLGTKRTRAILFLLAFLLFTLPIPLIFTESLHLELRQIATASSAYLVPWLGIPLYAEGTTLHIPNGSLQVADSCSGFSTLYASVAVACLMAYTCPDPRRRILVLLVAVPLAIVANIIRVVLLVVFVAWLGVDILETPLHPISGLLTFALVLPTIFWLGHVPAESGKSA